MKKRFKILIVVLVVIFVVLPIAAFITVKTVFPPQKIQNIVETQASQILKRDVKVGGADIKIFPLGIQIKDVKVANNPGAGFSEEPLLDLPLATVKIDLAKLLTFQVAIDKISFENMSLLYEIMPDGRTSIDGLGGEPDTAVKETPEEKDTAKLDLSNIELPGTLSLKSFSIDNAKVIFNDRSQKRKVILGDINLNVAVSLDKTLEDIKTSTALTLKEISMEDGGLGIRKGGISVFLNADIAANLRSQHIDVQSFSAGLQSINVNASGTVDNFLEKEIGVDLKVETNKINLAELIREIPAGINPEIPKVSAGGTASFDVAVKGAIVPEKLPSVSGNLVLNEIAISHSDLPAGISALTGNIAFTENTVSIKPFTFLLAGQPTSVLLDASDLLSPKPMLNELAFSAKLDLGALFTLAGKLVTIQELSELGGKLEADLNAKGVIDPARPENISVNGGAVLQNVTAKTPLIPDEITLNGAFKFSNTEISADPEVKIGNSDVKVKAVVKDYLVMVMPRLADGKKTNVNIDVRSSNLEIDRLLPPPGDTAKPTPEAAESIPMEQYPELPDLVANINVNLAKTEFMHLTLSDFNLGINYADAKVAVASKGRLYAGGFNANVGVDLSNRKSADVKFALNVDKVEANDFISNGNDNITGKTIIEKQIRDLDSTIFGKLNMKVDLKTNGLPQDFVNNLSGPIFVQIANGSFRGSKILGGVGKGISDFEVLGKKVLSGLVPVSDKGDMNFDDTKAELEAKDGQLLVKDFKINAKALGLLAFDGAVGFDGILDLKLQNTLNSTISSNLSNLTKSSPVALYPKDAKGNALLFFKIGGTLAEPKITLDTEKMKESVAGGIKDAVAAKLNEVKDKVMGKVEDVKDAALEKARELEDKAKEEADRLKKEAQAEADRAKKEAEDKAKAEAQAQTQKATEATKDKAKDALKGFKK